MGKNPAFGADKSGFGGFPSFAKPTSAAGMFGTTKTSADNGTNDFGAAKSGFGVLPTTANQISSFSVPV